MCCLLKYILEMLAGNGFGITGAASTVARDNLPRNVAFVSNDRGKNSSIVINCKQYSGQNHWRCYNYCRLQFGTEQKQ